MTCPICGEKTGILLLRDVGDGPRNMCRTCSTKTPRQQYYLILARLDAFKAKIELLLKDATDAKDEQTVWYCQQVLKDNARQRNELRCPAGVA